MMGNQNMYYSQDWQVIQDQSTVNLRQYVWGLGYVDALVLRDFNQDGSLATGDLGIKESGLEVRFYAMQDANWNVTGLVYKHESGVVSVMERYVYDPYGSFTCYNANWTLTANPNTPRWAWYYLHQGGRWNAVTGLYHFRNRDFSPTLGRWTQQDPAGYVDGGNLYEAYRSGPVSGVDPLGLYYFPTNPKDFAGNLLEYGWTNYGPPRLASALGKVWNSLWSKKTGNEGFAEWLTNHPHAAYGFPPENNPTGVSLRRPGAALGSCDVKTVSFELTRPAGATLFYAASAAVIGEGQPGSPKLRQVQGDDGYVYQMRSGARYSHAQNTARAGAAAASAHAANEVLNGLNRATVMAWTFGSLAGYYVLNQNETTGKVIVNDWVRR